MAIEIKPSTKIDPSEVRAFARYASAFGPKCEKYFVSQDRFRSETEGVQCLPYYDFFKEFFERR